MMTLEEIFKEYEKGCSNTCLGGKPSDCNECLEAAVRAVNRYQDAELSTLRAEVERLREALVRLEKIGDKVPVDIGLISLIAKEALE